MRKGIAVSPGVSIGTAYCIHEVFVDPGRQRLESHEVAGELARFENARKRSIDDVRQLKLKIEQQEGKEAAAIFAVHESILQDATLVRKVHEWISGDCMPAQAVLARVLEHYRGLLEKSGDAYLQERLADIRDVIERLTSFLSSALKQDSGVLVGPTIIVAEELLPSQVVMLGSKPVHGIVTQAGSQTSHAAIVARSRGIPAVSGVTGILRQTKTGDTIIVDGREGHVIVNPDAEVFAAYRKLEREFVNLRDELAHNRDQPAVTRDGHTTGTAGKHQWLGRRQFGEIHGGCRRRPLPHRVSIPDTCHRAQRRGAIGHLSRRDSGQPESCNHHSHAGHRRRQDGALPFAGAT